MKRISGVYETIYGNCCSYSEGDDYAFDLDMQEEIPLEMVDFTAYVRAED